MRYNKQETFSKIGKTGQELITSSTITILGIGALGTNTLNLLARAGVGKIKIIDRDVVELSNLQRQTLFSEEDIDKPKVYAAKEKINKINSKVKIETYLTDLDYENVEILKSGLILDCTDNIYTRFLINEYSRKNNIPWIYASVIGSKGMVMNVTEKTPCFNCIIKEPNEPLDTCDSSGVIGSAASAIASIQATEAIKILTKQDYCRELIHYDLWKNKINRIKVNKNKYCKTCNKVYEYLEGKKKKLIKICGSCNYQIEIKKDMNLVFAKLSSLRDVKPENECLILENAIIFKSGRALVKAENENKAKAILDGYLG
ncbi:ThiF family adenylyltransferase [Candidatus Woesearchaeota archaeon]|nr:ThiF family adenylyltransferase [Candidatus Woesearchaeota archaeon]